MRTRTRFLLLVLSILVPSFIAAALAVAYVYRDAQQAQNRSMAETARAMALLVDNELETRETLLLALAGAPSLERGDLPEFYEHARRAAAAPTSAVVLSATDGRMLLNHGAPTAVPCPRKAPRTWPNSGRAMESTAPWCRTCLSP